MRRVLGILVGLVVALAACGSSEGGSSEQAVESVDLGAVFAAAADADNYRILQSNGEVVRVDALGLDNGQEVDPDHPAVVTEVDGERVHTLIDLASVLGAFGEDLGPIELEMWVGPDRVVIDSTDYEEIRRLNPAAVLGPLEPGVSFVDLARLDVDAPDLVQTIVGNGAPDLSTMARELPAALGSLTRPDDRTFVGSASFAEVTEAMGGDIEALARSVSAGLGLNVPVDPAELTGVYVDFYRVTPAEVTVRLGNDGLIEVIEMTTDLAGIWNEVFGAADRLGIPATPAEIEQARSAFAGSEFTISTRTEFDFDGPVEVPPAPATDDDRTDAWIELLRTA